MIHKVEVEFLKMFRRETFELKDHIVLAGPNNSGKSTLLQAIVIWNLALQQWKTRRGSGSGSKATERTGLPLTRKDFTALPLREMSMLWTDTQTGLRKGERPEDQKAGQPRVLKVTLAGSDEDGKPWSQGFEFRYSNPEMVYCKPALDSKGTIPNDGAQVVYVPPFSGIGTEETVYSSRDYQDYLIGQGKPGDILRNLLVEVHKKDEDWKEICDRVQATFGYKLLPPEYEARPFIQCDYLRGVPRKGRGRDGLAQLDIVNAGSGFHQVLLLLAFFYARPATVLLLDEPDAHLHVILQEQIYQTLQTVASQRKCQLVIASHSEIILDRTSPQKILSFYGKPHLLQYEWERDQVREAIKRLPAQDILIAERSTSVLYTEGETDFDLLRAWAEVLNHPLSGWFKKEPFWHNNQGRHPREARGHFFALKALRPSIRGVLILDGDNRNLPDQEVSADDLTILRWRRYEAESYLCHPDALGRFVGTQYGDLFSLPAMDFLNDQVPPAVLKRPLDDHDFWVSNPVSKTLLPGFFKKAGLETAKMDYHLVARQMTPDEIPSEVKAKLDAIAEVLGL